MKTFTAPRVENMTSPSSGREVANQFLIYTEEGVLFQSYSTPIAFRDYSGHVTLNKASWDYSTTTGKYRNQFLNEGIADIRKKIENGTYTLAEF